MQSAAGTLQINVEELRNIQTLIKESNNGLNTAMRIADSIARRFEGANPQLASGWNSISKNLQFFSEQLANNIGEIYGALNTQLGDIAREEQQQEQIIDSYMSQGDKIIQGLNELLKKTN